MVQATDALKITPLVSKVCWKLRDIVVSIAGIDSTVVRALTEADSDDRKSSVTGIIVAVALIPMLALLLWLVLVLKESRESNGGSGERNGKERRLLDELLERDARKEKTE